MALAQDEAAEPSPRDLYDQGAQAYEAGDFDTALARFERAYELSRLPELLFNLASCHDRLEAPAEAIRYYEAYRAALPDAQNAPYVESRLILLREQADAQDPDPAEPDPTPPEEPEDRVEPSVEPTTQPVAQESPSAAGPITLMAVGGAAAVGAVVSGILALSSRAELDDVCDGLVCPSDAQSTHDAMKRRALAVDVLGGAAIALVTGGLVWLLLQPDDDGLQVACGLTGCSARMTW